jgi:hypothetical protein
VKKIMIYQAELTFINSVPVILSTRKKWYYYGNKTENCSRKVFIQNMAEEIA